MIIKKMYRKQSILFLILALVILYSPRMSVAQEILGDSNKFKKNNPDGQKFEFARDYITSLFYIKANVERSNETTQLAFNEQMDSKRTAILRDDLIRDNVNLRVARNYLKKYRNQRENKLMITVTESYYETCNNLIDINNKERKLYEDLYYTQLKDEMESFDQQRFERQHKRIASDRRKALKGLLKTSILVSKVLISNEDNYYGEFDRLGVTQEERYKLIYKIDEFEDEEYKGQLRAGQTFLEGSVSALREILEDFNYDTIDG